MIKNNSKRILMAVVGLALVIVDQVIKAWALGSLTEVGSIPVIDGLFSLTYVENRGAAFGMLQDKTRLLSVVTAAVLAVILYAFFRGVFKGRLLQWSVMVAVSGGVGNLIDRVARGFVVDYLDFSALFGFPVFNFADICVVCGTLAVLVCIFLYDDKHADSRLEAGAPPEEIGPSADGGES